MVDSSSGRLVQRMRLARRVAEALLPQEGDVVLAAASTAEVLAGPVYEGSLHTDFLLTTLDLQMRVALIVGQDRTALLNSELLKEANLLLWSNPESFACILVADDEPLTSRIVEAGDTIEERPQSAVLRHLRKIGPLREIVTAYLRSINPGWPEPTNVMNQNFVAFDQAAKRASLETLSVRRGARSPIPERKQARDSLSEDDAVWAAELALAAINEMSIDIDREIRSRKHTTGDM